MPSSARILTLVLAVGASLGAWGPRPGAARAAVMEDVVATVNGKPLLLSEFKKNLKSVLDNYQRNVPGLLRDQEAVKEVRHKVLDQMVDDELIAQEADKLKMKVYGRELEKGLEEVQERNFRVDDVSGQRRTDAQVEAALKRELEKEGLKEEQFRERIKRQLMIRKVVEEVVRPKVKEPSDERARDIFEKVKAFSVSGSTNVVKGWPEEDVGEFAMFASAVREHHAERVKVAHILVKLAPGAPIVDQNKALRKAEELKKRLDTGEDFYELAQKESDDLESAPRGGDLDYIVKGQLPPEFEKAAFALAVGDASAPVETRFGYHLIWVSERRARQSLVFDKLKPDIKQYLYNSDFRKDLQAYVKGLKSTATVEVKLPAE